MKRYLLHILLLSLVLLIPSSVWGVTLSGGNMSGTFTLTDNTKLTNKITVLANASLTIDLNGFVLYGDGPDYVIDVKGTLTIKDSNPNLGHTGYIDENGLFRWPYVDGKKAHVVNGGIIYNTYKDETTPRKGILVSSGTCTIEKGKIMGCYANGIGSAVTISSSGTFKMDAGEISYNYSKKSGLSGVIYGEAPNKNNGSSITISNTTISNNKTDGDGGAIYAYNLNLTNCTLEHNVAGNNGGALYVRGSDANLKVDNCRIRYNSGINGGGIFSQVNSVIDNSYIEYNYATTTGGGLYMSGTTTVQNSTINGNWAMSTETNAGGADRVDKGRGGGFNFTGEGIEFILDNTIVTNNTSMYYGGGGQLQGKGILTLKNNSKINSNTCVLFGAAGLHLTGGVTFFMESTTEISNNTSYGGVGGGIHSSYECFIHLDGGEISGNTVYGRGGGVHVNTGGNLVLNGTNIKNNKAYDGYSMVSSTVTKSADGKYTYSSPVPNNNSPYPGYGGGVLINSGSCTMEKGELSLNYAETLGGGIALIMTESANYAHHVRLTEFVLESGIVANNTTDGNGAGVYLMENVLSNLKDEEKSKYTQLTNDWTPKIKLNGGTISGNVAKGNGGAAYQETATKFIVSAGKTTELKGNQAQSGGAVYIAAGDFEVEGTATISNNTATEGHGGAVYLGKGNFTVGNSGTLVLGSSGAGNIAQKGNGGGIYCKGAFTVNGQTIISSNRAMNGGGVCVENGSVTLVDGKNSIVQSNEATNMGGGLYVFNGESSYQDASFQGGTFDGNMASAGGAVCADGKITLNLAANMEANIAKVGGGIYMANGVNMTFGNGLIRANKAEKNSETYTTAYLKDATNVAGVGGGIFIANNSTLEFDNDITEMGIYNNSADYGGADICANGNGTSITLPLVTGMELKGFDVPGNDLYWVYDYFNGDANKTDEYLGELPAIRYEDLLLTPPVDDGIGVENYTCDNKKEHTFNKYVCLDLGYDLIFVEFTTYGLDKTDNAMILMKYKKEIVDSRSVQYVLYRKVLFHGPQTKTIGLPSGEWMFESTKWIVDYEDPTFSKMLHGESCQVFQIDSKNKEIVATFVPKSDASTKAKVYEHYKVNRMRP